MKEQTKSEAVYSAYEGASSDRGSKNIWNNKEIVAPLLYMLVPEFEGMDTAQVMTYMDSEIRDFEVPVNDFDPAASGELSTLDVHLKGDENVLSSLHEKEICFDKYFTVINPRPHEVHAAMGHSPENDKCKLSFHLHIDLEMQKSCRPSNPSYPITKRAIMSVIIVRLGKESGKEEIFDYIDSIFTADIPRMQKYSDVVWQEDLEEEANSMITAEDYVGWRREAKARDQGLAEGMAKGENMSMVLISCLLNDGRSNDIRKVTEDESYRQQLFKEYNIE